MMGVCFQVFDGSIRQQDSELGKEISFLAQCVLNFPPYPFSIVWVNAFPHIVSAWKALHPIKPPDAVTLVRPIQQIPLSSPLQTPAPLLAYPLILTHPGLATP